jgi:hypothetical protein
MFMLMLSAFIAARFTHIRAQPANLIHEWAVCLHRFHRKRTHIRAFPVQADAFRHHIDIFFTQARIETTVARLHAINASPYALFN